MARCSMTVTGGMSSHVGKLPTASAVVASTSGASMPASPVMEARICVAIDAVRCGGTELPSMGT